MLHLREVQHDLGLGRVALQDRVIGRCQKRLPAQVGLEQPVRNQHTWNAGTQLTLDGNVGERRPEDGEHQVSGRLRNSRFGRALRAISTSELGASALGIHISRYKLAAFVIAALFASAAGSLFAHVVGFISPEVFGLQMVVVTFTMLYVGGVGTVLGPAIGAVIASLLPEIFRATGRLQDIAYALVLLLMLIFVPKGLSALGVIGKKPTAKPEKEG